MSGLDHLGVVAGVCQGIGLATYLDQLAGENNHHVSMGTATVAMILNELGFSNRRLYLVPQFFANKPVEHLLGPGIEAADLNDDCLARTLDWLYAQDPTQLFACMAMPAHKIFGVTARQVHVDTSSFAVSGEYTREEPGEDEASVIAINYGYSRDHREDLKQWMLARATLKRQVEKAEQKWKQKLWHLSNQRFACEADAQSTLARELKGLPGWLEVQSELVSAEHHPGRGRPRKDAAPTMQWHIQATLTVKQLQVEQEVRRKACFIVATNVLDTAVLSDQELVTTYKERGSVERGFRFLKDPLFLASLVFVKKPERIVTLGLVVVLCLLVYRLAEHRLRTRLADTEQTISDQLNRPTARPTMRWIFQCFEGIELLHIRSASSTQSLVLRLQPMHRLVLALLGPPYEKIYNVSS